MFACKSTFTKSTWIGKKSKIGSSLSYPICFHLTLAVNFTMHAHALLIYSRIVGFVMLRCEEYLFMRMDKNKWCSVLGLNQVQFMFDIYQPYNHTIFLNKNIMFSLRKSLSPCQSRQRPTVGVDRFCRSMFILLALLPIGGLVRLTSVFNCSNLFWTRRRQSRQSRGMFPYYW